ncbi:UNVERIFIED_CONTAM: hypothetical protein Sradi_5277900 [Sesamum radiatum]|uniref:Uncharacterized protein n=1 Tax=Sesamum radiatum TaxID=300843 RepID=A0AAW2LLW8_SESRA
MDEPMRVKVWSSGDRSKERKVSVFVKEIPTIEEAIHMVEEDESWKAPYMQYLKNGTLPSDPIAARRLQFKANKFTLLNDELYKRNPNGLLLKCLSEERARYVLSEIHEGSCGTTQKVEPWPRKL